MSNFYFQCNTNRSGPLLVLNTEWEAKEMRTNPDYDAVDEDGLPIVLDEPNAVAA